MSRKPVSVIMTASGSADDFHACLTSLRPTLGIRDEVVCLISPEQTELRAELPDQRWLRVVEHRDPEQVGRWRTGLAETGHDLVVLLDGDVILPAHWLDTVVAAFDDPQVVAAGPRCHRSFGPQKVDLPADALRSPAAFKAFARQWRQERRGQVSTVDELGIVCVALRREALDRAGGPTPDLPYEALREQGTIVVVQSAVVAHAATSGCVVGDRPWHHEVFVSGSLIVKDEQDTIAECLAAARPFVDELVVYDTGSTDRTREIAAECGARVVEGYWNDHFGDARNRALAHCRGQWIFQIDADEMADGDPAALRERLRATTAPGLSIEQVNFNERGSTTVIYPRLFQRARARHSGRLHEQVVDRVTGGPVGGVRCNEVRLLHGGHTRAVFAGKDKRARNFRLAELAAQEDEGSSATVNLAKAKFANGDRDGAIEVCLRGLERRPAGSARVGLLAVLAPAYAATGRPDEAERTLAELRASCREQATADTIEAHVRMELEQYERALELVQAMPDETYDDFLIATGRTALAAVEIVALYRLERHAEAAQRLRERLAVGAIPMLLNQIDLVMQAAGGGLADVVATVPRNKLRELLHASIDLPVPVADRLLPALWDRYGPDPLVVGYARWVGARLPVLATLEWSARLRQHGYAEQCPLLALAENPERQARDRSLAAAAALGTFGDERAMPLLAAALAEVPDEENELVMNELRMLVPEIAAAIEPAPV